MAEGDVNILQTMAHKVHGNKYRVPWTFKDGVYNLKINPDKKIHKANVEKLETHITNKHVQPNLNAGRKPDHGVKQVMIGDDEGRIGGVDKYKAGELTIKIRSKSQAKKNYLSRKGRTTLPDFETQKQMNVYNQISILRNGLNNKDLTRKEFDAKMTRLFKRERLQLPGLKVQQYDAKAFDKSPIANGWPKGASQEGYTKWLNQNFNKLKPEQKALQIKGKGDPSGLGSKVDIGHPRQGAPNIGMAMQPRYHPTQGNQSLRDIQEEFKPTDRKAKLTVGQDGSLNFVDTKTSKPIDSKRGQLKSATQDVRSKADLDTAGRPHRHRHALEIYLRQFAKPTRTTIEPERFSRSKNTAILFNPDLANADAATTQALHEKENTALRRKITIAQQSKPNKPPQHIRAKTPSNTLGLRNVVNLRSIQIGGGAALQTDVPSLKKSLDAVGRYSEDFHYSPFGIPIYKP